MLSRENAQFIGKLMANSLELFQYDTYFGELIYEYSKLVQIKPLQYKYGEHGICGVYCNIIKCFYEIKHNDDNYSVWEEDTGFHGIYENLDLAIKECNDHHRQRIAQLFNTDN